MKNYEELGSAITQWLTDYANDNGIKGFVVGVSGGIDSAVVSTLCAKTNKPTVVVTMPIHQTKQENDRANNHIKWLCEHSNVKSKNIPLSNIYNTVTMTLGYHQAFSDKSDYEFNSEEIKLALANTRSRLRMTTLYAIANSMNYMVVGTGNKIEDYGIGFFTKYGDGGVDISPIGDLLKSEVYKLGKALGINEEIIAAKPTDGLWEDQRTDEEQIGATYDELEWAMQVTDGEIVIPDGFMTNREKEVMGIYEKRHIANKHKMEMPPVFGDKWRYILQK